MPVSPRPRPRPRLRRLGFALGVLSTLATGGAECGDTTNPEPVANTPEGRAVQNASRVLEATGVGVDTARLAVETKTRDQLDADLGSQVALGIRPDQLDALWHLRSVLEVTPTVRSVEALRRTAVEARAPGTRVYYSATRKAMVFVEPEQQDPTSLDAAAAGQLVYAFYDQGPGGLAEALYEANGELDGIRVRLCMLEGHARLAEALVRHSNIDRLDEAALAELTAPPTKLIASISDTPCGEGARFLYERYREGGWSEVLRSVRAPPPSSEQLMHPAKVDQDFPVNLGLPGWPLDEYGETDPIGKADKVYDDVIGELTLHHLLVERGMDPNEALRAAVGWDGDRLQIYEHESGMEIIVWRSAWDRKVDAEQFAAAIAPKGIEPRAFAVQVRGRIVDAISTSDPRLTERLHARLAENTSEPAAQPADAASTAAIEGRL